MKGLWSMSNIHRIRTAEDFDCLSIYQFDDGGDLTIRGSRGEVTCLADSIPLLPGYFMLQGNSFEEGDIVVGGRKRDQLRIPVLPHHPIYSLLGTVYRNYIVTELTGTTAMVLDEQVFQSDPNRYMTDRIVEIVAGIDPAKMSDYGLGYLQVPQSSASS